MHSVIVGMVWIFNELMNDNLDKDDCIIQGLLTPYTLIWEQILTSL